MGKTLEFSLSVTDCENREENFLLNYGFYGENIGSFILGSFDNYNNGLSDEEQAKCCLEVIKTLKRIVEKMGYEDLLND